MLFKSVEIQVEKNESDEYQLCFFWDNEYQKLKPESPCSPILRHTTQKQKKQPSLFSSHNELIQKIQQNGTELTQQSKEHVQEIKWDKLQSTIDNIRQSDKSDIEIIPLPEYEKMGEKYHHFKISIYPTEDNTDTEIYIQCEGISGLPVCGG